MASYDRFAPHFDAWQRAFGPPYDELVLPHLLAALARHGRDVRRIADLGAGTGDLAVALARRGFAVVGVDCSVPMLALARAKAAAAGLAEPPVFVAQDLRALQLARPVDAAVCVYTVMNQLTGDGDLDRALAAVRGALVPGGLFLFELNLAASYARYWSGTETVRLADAVVVREHRRLAGAPVIEARVRIRGPEGEAEDRIAQRLYTEVEVEHAVAAAGLDVVERTEFNPFAAHGPAMKALWVVRRRCGR
ncbi:MAG TPA: methyltransferase domain-containing protein [Candidatus Binatia bacterium]|nr:methyltransferase domain-containing protein [Candidatus Binatia bacterium]